MCIYPQHCQYVCVSTKHQSSTSKSVECSSLIQVVVVEMVPCKDVGTTVSNFLLRLICSFPFSPYQTLVLCIFKSKMD